MINFIRWQLRTWGKALMKFRLGEIMIILIVILSSLSIFVHSVWPLVAAGTIMLIVLFNELVIKYFQKSYARYQREKRELAEVIKKDWD